MALLKNLDSNEFIYLFAYHSFGRLIYSVNTLMPRPEISKIHAVMEWDGTLWYIRDISKNGTWLNQKKLIPTKNHQLNNGDTIAFGSLTGISMQVKNVDPPQDFLEPALKTNSNLSPIPLTDYMLLPNEKTPEIIIFYDKIKMKWCYEDITSEDHIVRTLSEETPIYFSKSQWYFRNNRIQESTQNLDSTLISIEQLIFEFSVSQDEENVELSFFLFERQFSLKLRTHHYLTLLLARYRANDIKKCLDKSSQGWVYTEQLAGDLGIEISHLNIQIHRARKQFIDVAENVTNSLNIIERRPGEIRFGGTQLKIIKGGVEEITTNKIKETLI